VALMTQAEFARHRKVTKPAVSNWKKKGLLILAQDPADSRIKVDVAATEANLDRNVDPMRGRPPATPTPVTAETPAGLPLEGGGGAAPAPAGDDLAGERHAELRERRIGAALKNAQLAGDLVPLVEAERRVAEGARVARERMQAWLRTMAERFAAEREPRAIVTLGEEGIDQVFAELADQAGRGDFAGEDDDELTAEERAELDAAADEA